MKKIVLAYSGGLDTSIILRWLQENYKAEVIAYTSDIGQEIDRKKIIANAKRLGVKKIIIEDLKNIFVKDYVFPMIRGHAIYEGVYLLGTSIARPLIAKDQIRIAKKYNLNFFDATCPLVTKVHMEVIKYAQQGRDVIMIGHKNHPEVEGTLGRFPSESSGKIYLVEDEKDAQNLNISQPSNLALVTQTTLSVDDTKQIIEILKKRFPEIKSPNADDICYATQNRQDAVKQLALETDFIIVVGSENSSNSNRLKELAELMGTESCLVDHISQLSEDSLKNISKLGITSGASAPEELVKEIISYCKGFGFSIVEEIQGLKENISFKLPKELR